MKVSLYISSVLLMGVALGPLGAQGVKESTIDLGVKLIKNATTADDAWLAIAKLTEGHANGKDRNIPSDADSISMDERLLQASLASKAFYEKFPHDPRASGARKSEALYALQSVLKGGSKGRALAHAISNAYRVDKNNTAKDRFDVAFLADGIILAEKLKGKRFIDDGPAYEKLADGLYSELGATTETIGLYVSVARVVDTDTSLRVATKIAGLGSAPEWALQQAKNLIERHKLIGKNLDIKLQMLGGLTINLSKENDTPTVLCFWNMADGRFDLDVFERFKAKITTKARWLFITVGGDVPRLEPLPPGTTYVDNRCWDVAQDSPRPTQALVVTQTPYAYVLNKTGKLVGYGYPEKISALLELASR